MMTTIAKKRGIRLVLISALIALPAAAIFFTTHYVRYKKPNVTNEYVFHIYKHYDYNRLLDTLESSGSVKNWKSFKRAAESKGIEFFFEPGRYVLKEGMSNQTIIRTIANAWETPTKLILSGYVRSHEKLASVLSKWCEADSLEFITTLNDSTFRDSLGFCNESYLGMFIPNTYEVFWTVKPRDLLIRFKKEYDHFWTPERKSKAAKIGLSQKEVSTLAAIVVEESKYVPEQPTIAGVYLNRLRIGMKLQADPTAVYAALKLNPDTSLKRVLIKHTRVKSPYNTYLHKGLPPGPITIPTISAIEAVLNPKKHSYLYFCAKPELDGTHHFASSYRQHLRNARAYHQTMNKRK